MVRVRVQLRSFGQALAIPGAARASKEILIDIMILPKLLNDKDAEQQIIQAMALLSDPSSDLARLTGQADMRRKHADKIIRVCKIPPAVVEAAQQEMGWRVVKRQRTGPRPMVRPKADKPASEDEQRVAAHLLIFFHKGGIRGR